MLGIQGSLRLSCVVSVIDFFRRRGKKTMIVPMPYTIQIGIVFAMSSVHPNLSLRRIIARRQTRQIRESTMPILLIRVVLFICFGPVERPV